MVLRDIFQANLGFIEYLTGFKSMMGVDVGRG